MSEFLIGLGVVMAGSYALSQFDSSRATSMQQASCKAQGGTWGGAVGATTAAAPNPDICNLNGQAVNSAYTMWGATVDLGVPIVAGLLLTRSLPGALGVGIGAAAMFLLAVSSIH